MSSVTVTVPAKVNLQLSIGDVDPAGYHDVVTVYQAVSLYDEVTAASHEAARIDISVDGEDADRVPADDTNLAVRASRALARAAGVPAAVRLHLHKRISVAGGMAGGSADAAATLVACNELWGTGLSADELRRLAAELGSDVPFTLLGGTAVGTGRGERLAPIPVRGRYHWVFAVSDVGLSTPAVYAECDRLRGAEIPRLARSEPLVQALRAGDPEALGRALHNDAQAAAFSLRPQLREVMGVGVGAGALGAVVAGTGPTCAFLVRDETHAGSVAAALSHAGVCRAAHYAYGPVSGPRVVRRSRHGARPAVAVSAERS